ncbi:DAK2 domain-containing protein [Mycoplasmopsis pulmonis]|uniref:DAK2 domain-containing protein n=1 Tax=Mycoplasmopsis pulmonis TaxID=2107 RepID=UPI002ACEFD90|nr:DAK2 domain-containing protein [Mycoplasmopsis pulmonis]MDZ7293129.1 DAK2 domain-containing protein [Mycoplasmopsis pulmonis]
MIKNKIGGHEWSKAFISASNNLQNHKNEINALNVFPVPDGDTGTNMVATVVDSTLLLEDEKESSIGLISEIISKNMLLSARGNSGVILSQIFKGFSLAFQGKKTINIAEAIDGFEQAYKSAYSAVLRPVEGTILTVVRETYEHLFKNKSNIDDFISFFKKAVEGAEKSLAKTPEKLPILKEVGVVDSGGRGFVEILKGFLAFFQDEPIALKQLDSSDSAFFLSKEVYDGEFGYCSEFILELNDEKIKKFNRDKFATKLEKIASSVVIIHDKNILKVHAHVEEPGVFLNMAQKFGEFTKIKIENMTEQANESKKLTNQEVTSLISKVNQVSGIVSCNLGQGFIDEMKELGCNFVIESGQSQNPSAKEIMEAIESVGAPNVFVLPNNSNIFLAAQQAAQTVKDKNVYVMQTKSQVEGIVAMEYFNHEASYEDNKELMEEALENVQTGEVTKASRSTKINDVKINKDEYLAIANGKIVGSEKTNVEAFKKVLKHLVNENSDLITIYYGDWVSKTEIEELTNFIEIKYEVEIKIKNGKQLVYDFLIGVE